MVGGGIIGAACADELTRRGATVTLIERDELAAGASGRNQGLWVPPEDPALRELATRSLARYLEVPDEAALPVWIDPAPIGTVYVAVDDDAVPATKRMVASMRSNGVATDTLEGAALAETEPEIRPDVSGAWFIHEGHRLDPAALTVALALLASSRGATIRHHLSVRAADPIWMLTAPIPATQYALSRSGLTLADIDLVEINEAFASVVLAWQRDLDADPARVNVNGGAIALGHPLGATGARLMTSLLHELERRGARYGLQTMCEGGGQANVTIIERL